ncbi:hypothetical protein FHX10_006543 [Rhizobium sp. BK591]|uniref:hypothetical protein n=1 Tax=Rhizobium sp. BK591 TaxID=2586985 RepID=UPI00104551B9|nr:hypothetical protein [Rhizobium sp. BK591]MBB3746990.1 hypothetical protein [Rhizobium sp. BK591]
MAVEASSIIAVRVADADGVYKELPWNPTTRYLIRDDKPYLDVLVRGPLLNARMDLKDESKLRDLKEIQESGARWQRWDLETYLARFRRFGEINLELKVPKNSALRCYIIPTALLDLRDVIAMVDDIESELGIVAAWDVDSPKPERSWSRGTDRKGSITALEIIREASEELAAAASLRREPFIELGPRSRRNLPLPENAVVSHWAARRCAQLRDCAAACMAEIQSLEDRATRGHAERRRERIEERLATLISVKMELEDLTSIIARFGNDSTELNTLVYPTPLFHRDHRLRLLLRAFSPLMSEAIAESEALRSRYPPIFLTKLWEFWGAVWLVKVFRELGFAGHCITELKKAPDACSWRLRKGDMQIELDFEAEPNYVDYSKIPPSHERAVPVLEWAALNQEMDPERPFLGLEEKCTPDYLLRITVGDERILVVGDATLASAEHHHKDPKPKTVEKYRRTLGWSVDGGIVRCHPMGGFVIFPPPSSSWKEFEVIPGAADCVIFAPGPRDSEIAKHRLLSLLGAISPNLKANLEP